MPLSQYKVKETITKKSFTVIANVLRFFLVNNFNQLIMYKFALNHSPIYQFVSCQDFIYFCSNNVHSSYFVIPDHV